jgi:hypothetical protein
LGVLALAANLVIHLNLSMSSSKTLSKNQNHTVKVHGIMEIVFPKTANPRLRCYF